MTPRRPYRRALARAAVVFAFSLPAALALLWAQPGLAQSFTLDLGDGGTSTGRLEIGRAHV